MIRRGPFSVVLLALTIVGLRAQPAAPPDAFELSEATTSQLQEWMASGRFTARRIAELYLQRIRDIDQSGPTLRSVIEINPDALTIADAMDVERKRQGPRGPLHGIPVLIKDNIDTADRMTTTAGSLALEGSIAPRDAFVAAKLRAAGAIILGKTNLSEWANFRSPFSTSGWSGRGGLVKNPYVLNRNACGSSASGFFTSPPVSPAAGGKWRGLVLPRIIAPAERDAATNASRTAIESPLERKREGGGRHPVGGVDIVPL